MTVTIIITKANAPPPFKWKQLLRWRWAEVALVADRSLQFNPLKALAMEGPGGVLIMQLIKKSNDKRTSDRQKRTLYIFHKFIIINMILVLRF